jgi:hypothetical protein
MGCRRAIDTTGLFEAPTGGQRDWYGKWISYVREFDIKSLRSGESKIALGLADADRRAVIHDVINVSADLFVAFYSANGGVKAAISDSPDGSFKHSLIEATDDVLTLWVGYDSYHVDQTAGQLGWAKVRINKKSGSVGLIEKHPGNPLPMIPRNSIAARCGGNLAASVRLGDQYVFFYYTRPSKQKIMLTAPLSSNRL